jgi:hypothetical protein
MGACEVAVQSQSGPPKKEVDSYPTIYCCLTMDLDQWQNRRMCWPIMDEGNFDNIRIIFLWQGCYGIRGNR